jgi:hypothetical protein
MTFVGIVACQVGSPHGGAERPGVRAIRSMSAAGYRGGGASTGR